MVSVSVEKLPGLVKLRMTFGLPSKLHWRQPNPLSFPVSKSRYRLVNFVRVVLRLGWPVPGSWNILFSCRSLRQGAMVFGHYWIAIGLKEYFAVSKVLENNLNNT